MRVNMGAKIYEMSNKQAKAILETTKKLANCNIYGVEKDNVLIMLNEKYESKNELDKDIAKFRNKGFKVYYNE